MQTNKQNKVVIWVIAGVLLLALVVAIWGRDLFRALGGAAPRSYTVASVPLGDVSKDLPALPDISGFTIAAMEKKIPPLAPGNVRTVAFPDHRFYSDTFAKKDVSVFAAMQGREQPLVIEISSGVYDLDTLIAAVGDSSMIEKTTDAYVIKYPIVVQPGAGFVIVKPSLPIRLVVETASFIANFGTMVILDADISGWKSTTNAPAVFEKKDDYRPYLVFWSNSVAYLGRNRFAHLGYDFPKSYGISYASSPPFLREDAAVPRPTGWVLECVFDDIYYGFYSYEADDVAIIGNTYKDNIVYGIDPHDRSRRLIIAKNNSYGAKKRHGIIVSREVNDSWIFDNHSHDNHGSGIMIDRKSVRNVVARNVSENNGADGLVFFESPDNLSWENKIRNNAKNGIRIRNSWNIRLRGDEIVDNGMYGLVSYTASLEDQETRDTTYDPYEQRASFDMADARMGANKEGHFQIINNETARLQGLTIFSTSLNIFGGDLESVSASLYEAATSGKQAVVIEQTYKGGAAENTVKDSVEDADPSAGHKE